MEEGWLECPWIQAIRKAHAASSYSARQLNLGLVGPSCLSSAAMPLMSPWTHCEPRVSQLLGATAVRMGVTAGTLLQPGHLLPSGQLTYFYLSCCALSSCPLAAPLAEDRG